MDDRDRATRSSVARGALPLYSLTADLNGDHQVGFADLLSLAQGYGSRTQPALDINGDGVIDFKDLLILTQHYGEQVTGA